MLPKLCGTDVELGNFVLGSSHPTNTCAEASQALLDEIEGFRSERPWPASAWTSYSIYDERADAAGLRVAPSSSVARNRQDVGRIFLANGGCAYIDLNHLELATPETIGAFDQVACMHAMLRVAQRSLRRANDRMPQGLKIQALVNNSDGAGNSYGAHCNFLVTREAFNSIFRRRLQLLLYLAAFQASSIVFTGQGKIGSENGVPAIDFQLSQRADFMETLTGEQTTYRRPIVNARDEPLCGARTWDDTDLRMARLHVIFFDSTLCHVATLLKLGATQIVLAMLEAGRIDAELILDDPLDALLRWSRDPGLETRAELASGHTLTAVEMQQRFLDDAARFVASGRCAGIVPRAADIVALWARTLDRLERRDFEALAADLDWVLKRSILQRLMRRRPDLRWNSPQAKHLDLLFSSLDPAEGLYWAYERDGLVERVASEEQIDRLTEHPPEDTRAWTRAMLLSSAGADRVEEVNWDHVRVTTRYSGGWLASKTVHLADPLAWSRAETADVFESSIDVDEVMDRLAAAGSNGGSVHVQ